MFPTLFLLIVFFLINLLELISFDKLDLFDNEYDNDGSGCGSPVTCAFPFFSDESVGSVDKYVGRVKGIGSGVFVPTGIESIGDVPLAVFAPKGVESKGGGLIESFWRPKS